MQDDKPSTLTTDRQPQLAVERNRNKVTLEITFSDDYAAMLLYEQVTTSAAEIGEITVSLEVECAG